MNGRCSHLVQRLKAGHTIASCCVIAHAPPFQLSQKNSAIRYHEARTLLAVPVFFRKKAGWQTSKLFKRGD